MRSIWLIPLLAACHQRAPAPPPPPPSNTVEAPTCPDELTCMTMADPPACCPQQGMGPDPEPEEIPETLDRDTILAGIARVKWRAQACGRQFPQATGVVKVRVKVSPEGHPVDVVIDQAPDPGLGVCVAAAMRYATFAVTVEGGSFSYPFKF